MRCIVDAKVISESASVGVCAADPNAAALDDGALDGLLFGLGPGSEAAIAELIAGYVDDARPIFDQMRRALVERDMAELSRLAHGLKSSSASVGAMALSEQCRIIEQFARQPACRAPSALPGAEWGWLGQRLADVSRAFDRLRPLLEARRQRLLAAGESAVHRSTRTNTYLPVNPTWALGPPEGEVEGADR